MFTRKFNFGNALGLSLAALLGGGMGFVLLTGSVSSLALMVGIPAGLLAFIAGGFLNLAKKKQ
jgi:hypothetical protein